MGPSKQNTGEVEVDLGRYELRRFGQRIKIEKKPMDLLIFLLERREQMVSREDIVNKLWRSDLFIDTEKNVNNIVRKLRTALGDNADRPRFLETVVGKGYRFVGPVRVIDAKYPVSDPEPKLGAHEPPEGWQRMGRARFHRRAAAVAPGKGDGRPGIVPWVCGRADFASSEIYRPWMCYPLRRS